MDNSFKPELANEVKGLPCYIYSYQRDSGDGSTHTVYLFSKADYDLVRDDYDTWQPECHGGLGKHLTITGSPEYKEAIANSVRIRTYTKIMEKAPRAAHLFFARMEQRWLGRFIPCISVSSILTCAINSLSPNWIWHQPSKLTQCWFESSWGDIM